MKDVRELNVLDDSLEATARSARSSAFATAAACIAATQEKEGLFANPLKPPGKTADPAGTCHGSTQNTHDPPLHKSTTEWWSTSWPAYVRLITIVSSLLLN